MNIEENIKIIKEAYSILKESYGLRSDTLDMQASYFKGLTKTDYKNLDDKSKAMRQDFIKILTTINGINHLYSSYQKGEYQSLYYVESLVAVNFRVQSFPGKIERSRYQTASLRSR